MRAEFDQIGVQMSERSDLAHAADTIIAAHRIRQLTATISGADVPNDVDLSEHCAIVGNFGRYLGLGVLRRTEVYDAQVLPNSKDEIGYALKECATRLPLSEEEIMLLGEMYCYLSYFHERWDSSEDGDVGDLFARSDAEGRQRRSEWKAQLSRKPLSRFSKLISSWLRPNA